MIDFTTFKASKDNYVEVGIIGQGGNGTIILIKDKKEEEFYVLKIFNPFELLDVEYRMEAFQTTFEESEQIRNFNDPALKVFESFPCTLSQVNNKSISYPWILMDYIPGCSLADYLNFLYKRNLYLKPLPKYKIIYGIARMLQKLHEKKIYHRDMKPDNILLDGDLNPHLADFGDASSHEITTRDHGTVYYKAPEIIAHECPGEPKPCNAKTDIYSFGGTIVYIISLDFPFMNLPENVIKEKISSGEIDDHFEKLGIILKDDKLLYDMYKNCCAKDPNERLNLNELITVVEELAYTYITDENEINEFNEYAESLDDDDDINTDEPTANKESIRKAIENGLHFAPGEFYYDNDKDSVNVPLVKAAEMVGITPSEKVTQKMLDKFSFLPNKDQFI